VLVTVFVIYPGFHVVNVEVVTTGFERVEIDVAYAGVQRLEVVQLQVELGVTGEVGVLDVVVP